MSDKIREFLLKVQGDAAMQEEFKEVSRKIEHVSARDEALEQHMIPFAKKHGFSFVVADFAPPEGEMMEDELMSVSGGRYCNCSGAGVGDNGCACPYNGEGENGATSNFSCYCCGSGTGQRLF